MRWQDELRQLAPGGVMVRLTDGRYGRMHILKELLQLAGPSADMLVLSWCIGVAEGGWLRALAGRGHRVRVLMDRGVLRAAVDQGRAQAVLGGAVEVRATRTHAKLDVVRTAGDIWAVSGSANLNPNLRLENWTLVRGDAALGVAALAEAVWEQAHPLNASAGPRVAAQAAQADRTFRRMGRALKLGAADVAVGELGGAIVGRQAEALGSKQELLALLRGDCD